MKNTYVTSWLDNMAFEIEINGHKVLMDADDFGRWGEYRT